jgi:hypothetical protein
LAFLVGVLALLPLAAIAQATFGSGSGVSCPGGNVICNGSTNYLSTELFFEPETPFQSLKEGPPTWNEMEQLLDDPYAVVTGCTDEKGLIPPNDQGFPTYCTAPGFIRRPTFGVTLPPMLVHPLNYNPATGAEMRLINPNFAGGPFDNTTICYGTDTTGCTPTQSIITVSPGSTRVFDTEIDYAVAIGRKAPFCQANPEPVPLASPMTPSTSLQDIIVCGSDSGEPGAQSRAFLPDGPLMQDNLGLPVANQSTTTWYSVPAVPAPNSQIAARMQLALGSLGPSTPVGTALPITAPQFRLRDPFRGIIQPRNGGSGQGGLNKPSLRTAEVGGNGANPNYLWNSAANLAARGGDDQLAPSNENDYVGLFGLGTNRPT